MKARLLNEKQLEKLGKKAFIRTNEDPDYPLVERALAAKMKLVAKGYMQAMFGDPEQYRPVSLSGEEVKELIAVLDALPRALGRREDLVASARARRIQKPVRAKEPIKEKTIEAMRKWRRNYGTLDGFIEAAMNNEFEGDYLEIEENETDYLIVFNDKKKKAASSTLANWWAEAGKQKL